MNLMGYSLGFNSTEVSGLCSNPSFHSVNWSKSSSWPCFRMPASFLIYGKLRERKVIVGSQGKRHIAKIPFLLFSSFSLLTFDIKLIRA